MAEETGFWKVSDTGDVQVKSQGRVVSEKHLKLLALIYARQEPFHGDIDVNSLNQLDLAHQAAILLARYYLADNKIPLDP